MRRLVLATWAAASVLVIGFIPPIGRAQVVVSTGPTTLAGSVPTLVTTGQAQLVGPHPQQDTLSLVFGLPLRNQAALDQFLQQVNDRSSTAYHHFLSQATTNQQFDPTAQQEQQVVSWLQAHGLAVTQTYPNHLLVDARGTVAQVDQLLHTTINDYQAKARSKTVSFYAPATDAVIDSSVSDVVQSVVGLDSYPRFYTLSNGSPHGSPAYYPQDFASAYDVEPLWDSGYTGTGQHIGITLWTQPPADSALQHFAQVTGANVATTANGRLKVIPVDGGSQWSDGGEAGLDIEYSSGMAPGAAIDFYEATTNAYGSPTAASLDDALNMAGTDANGNAQITNSWGSCEAGAANDPFTVVTTNILASNSATGHDYLFASGDEGSYCYFPSDGVGEDPYPDFPASSPYVTSVGGTAFTADLNGTYQPESSWVLCPNWMPVCQNGGGGPQGSGGGYSNLFSRPTWQVGDGLAANGMRGYPDVAADADPVTGAYVCSGGSVQTCDQVGGTSLASPLWAGMLADVNQDLAAHGQSGIGFVTPELYQLNTHVEPLPAFHDITIGTNGFYNAGAGWNAVTGWGSPDMNNLAHDLLAGDGPPTTPVPTPTPDPAPTSSTESNVYQITPDHAGYLSDTTLTPPLTRRWTRNLNDTDISYPLVADGRVFVTTGLPDGAFGAMVYSLDASTGATIWSQSIPDTFYFADAAYDNGSVFVVNSLGLLQSFNALTGAKNWSLQLPGQEGSIAPPVASDGTVYVARNGATLYAVSESTGTVLWSAPYNYSASSATLSSTDVYVSGGCGQAYAFDRTSGQQLWHYSPSCSGGDGFAPVLHDGKLYVHTVASPCSPQCILDPSTGTLLGSFASDTPPAFDGTTMLTLVSGTLKAEDTGTGATLWQFTGDGNLITPPVVVNNTVFVGSGHGMMYGLDVATGQVLWQTYMGAVIGAADENNPDVTNALGAGEGMLFVPAGPLLMAFQPVMQGPPNPSPTPTATPVASAPQVLTATQTQQYTLTGSDGDTWVDMDPANLKFTLTPTSTGQAILSANADLWTSSAGYNQDIGIWVSGGAYGSGQLVAWKESGGFAGTYSPNAAFVQTLIPIQAGTTYTVKLQWKANKSDPGTIWAGAGPISGTYSPTRLTAEVVPGS